MAPEEIISAYFAAFNKGDTAGMEALVSGDIEHRVNQGGIRSGADAFAEFNRHMTKCYREELTDIVIFTTRSDNRAAAEFTVNGTYLETDDGLPEASGQTYSLPAGSFFELKDGRISRISTYYNLNDWLEQIGAGGTEA